MEEFSYQAPEVQATKLFERLSNEEALGNDVGVVLGVLIYLRWIDFQEAEQEAISDFDGSFYEHLMPLPLLWRNWYDSPSDRLVSLLGVKIPEFIGRFRNHRNNILATNLHRLTDPLKLISRMSPYGLVTLVRWVAEQPFETRADRKRLLEVYDTVLESSSDRISGEAKTPVAIARLIVELASPSSGDHIYDPCFGSAGLLTSVVEFANSHVGAEIVSRGRDTISISGIEINNQNYIVGLTRLILSGIENPHLELGNSLEREPSGSKEGFDIVIANPPWGQRVNPDLTSHFPIRMTDSTGLFIQHALSQLKAGGRAILVVPQGFLFRGGGESRLRKTLVEHNQVESVIALPKGVFLPYTGVQASILIFRKGGMTRKIRMVDAESYFENGKGKTPAHIRPGSVMQLVEKIRSSKISEDSWDIESKTLGATNWDFTARRRDENSLENLFGNLPTPVELVKLKECCDVRLGKSVKAADVIETQKGGSAVPYIRIKDVQRGLVSKGTSWLSKEFAAKTESKSRLRSGDVLLSKSGTIGKVGVVQNGSVGGLAGNGFYVIHCNTNVVDPHYLVAYLDSDQCRKWLNDRATGAVISHLSKSNIEALPIPIPPLNLQKKISDEYRERGIDVVNYLIQYYSASEIDPILIWLEKSLSLVPSNVDDISDPFDFTLLESLFEQLRPLRNQVAHSQSNAKQLTSWILSFYESISPLRGIRSIPRGPSLLSLLQDAMRGLSNSINEVVGPSPAEHNAKKLSKAIFAWLEKSTRTLIGDVKIAFESGSASLNSDTLSEIELKISNQSALPLRDFAIMTEPNWGDFNIGFFAEGSQSTINLKGITPKQVGIFNIKVSWSCSALDGRSLKGSRQLAFNIVDKVNVANESPAEFGGSPYVCGDPVRPERGDVFFGREELLDQIRRHVIKSGNVVLLEGNRRSGKTSILSHLEGETFIPGWLGVYCSLQGAEGSTVNVGVPTVEVFREMAKSIAKGVHALKMNTPLPNGTILPAEKKLGIAKACREGITEGSPFNDFRDYVELILETLKAKNLNLLLMMDEFDKLQEGIDSGVTSPQVPENIRFLVQTYPGFSAMLTGSRRLKRLREEYWSALFGLGTRIGVTALPKEDAMKLITKPVEGRLIYSKEAVEKAYELTAGQPYLLQCLCNRIFDAAAQLKIRSITLDTVEKASKALVEDNEHFASLWDYAGSDRRRYILAVCQREKDSADLLHLGVLRDLLSRKGVEVADEALIADLEYLRELEVIELVGDTSGGHYKLAIPLMGEWIERQQDFAALTSKARIETEDQGV